MSRRQSCLVCHEPADTEAPLCRVCVADGCRYEETADGGNVIIEIGVTLL